MPSLAVVAAFVRSVSRRFRRNRQGSAVVEFALVAPIFFALLFAIIEVAMVFYASQVLETVTQDTARLVLTGQAQAASYSAQQFKDQICSHITVMLDCQNLITVDVRSYPSFSNITIADPIDANKQFVNNMKYCPGKGGDTVVMRVYYPWQLLVTGLGFNVANLAGSKRLLAATAAFVNEPFAIPGATCS